MLSQGNAVEAPYKQIVVHVVTGVPDRDILEQMTVFPQDVFRPGPHLLVVAEYAPLSDIPHLVEVTGEEMCHHIIQTLHHHRRCNGLVAFLSIWGFQI